MPGALIVEISQIDKTIFSPMQTLTARIAPSAAVIATSFGPGEGWT